MEITCFLIVSFCKLQKQTAATISVNPNEKELNISGALDVIVFFT